MQGVSHKTSPYPCEWNLRGITLGVLPVNSFPLLRLPPHLLKNDCRCCFWNPNILYNHRSALVLGNLGAVRVVSVVPVQRVLLQTPLIFKSPMIRDHFRARNWRILMDRREFLQSGALAACCTLGGFAQNRTTPPSRVLVVCGASEDVQPADGSIKLSGKLCLYDFKDGQAHRVWDVPVARQGVGVGYCDPIIADVDGDGQNELLAMDDEELFVWKTPAMTAYRLPIEKTRTFPALAVGDPDKHGIRDIFAARTQAGVGVYRFDGKTLTTIAPPMPIGNLNIYTQTHVFDVNHDGRPEILIGGRPSGENQNHVYIVGLENGKLIEQTRIPTRTSINNSVRFADVDNDGANEIVISGSAIEPAEHFEGIIAWRHDKRTGKYDQVLEHQIDRSSPEAMNIGDVDGDGKNEIVIATSGAHGHKGDDMIKQQYVFVLRHDRTGFQTLFNEPTGVMAHYGGVAIGDLDHDGKNEFSVQGKYVYKHLNGTYHRTTVPNMRSTWYCTTGELAIN